MERPQWLKDYCLLVQEALHLHAWNITYEMSDMPVPSRPTCHAACTINYPYWQATIEFQPSSFLEPSKGGKLAVVHEHLHLCLAELGHAAEQAANSFMTKARDRRNFLQHIYYDAEERCITRLERAIYEMLEPKEPAVAAPAEPAKESADEQQPAAV